MRNDRLKWLREMREARFEGKSEAVTKSPVTKPSAPTKLNKPQSGLQLVEVESHHEDYAKPLGQQQLKDGRGADDEDVVAFNADFSTHCRRYPRGRAPRAASGRGTLSALWFREHARSR
jgi:hypothetical protein